MASMSAKLAGMKFENVLIEEIKEEEEEEEEEEEGGGKGKGKGRKGKRI